MATIRSKRSKSSGEICRAAPATAIPRRRAASVARASGGSPTCQPPVPALSSSMRSSRPASRTSERITPSAVGERQMLPMQTKRTRAIRRLELLHDHRLAHAAGHAHRLEAVGAAGLVEAVEQRGHDARAGHPEWVAEGNGSAERVELLGVEAPLLHARNDLGGERLVE